MERARITSKGQMTIPKRVRDALDLAEGDELVSRVERSRAVVAKTPRFLDLAGSVTVPRQAEHLVGRDCLADLRRTHEAPLTAYLTPTWSSVT